MIWSSEERPTWWFVVVVVVVVVFVVFVVVLLLLLLLLLSFLCCCYYWSINFVSVFLLLLLNIIRCTAKFCFVKLWGTICIFFVILVVRCSQHLNFRHNHSRNSDGYLEKCWMSVNFDHSGFNLEKFNWITFISVLPFPHYERKTLIKPLIAISKKRSWFE